MKEKQKLKSKKGITLIALVVTIIVLIILAGISITLILGENGIISKSKYAKQVNEIEKEKEQIVLAYNAAKINKLGETVVAEDINQQFRLNGTKANATDGIENLGVAFIRIIFLDSRREYIIHENGTITGPLEETEISNINMTPTNYEYAFWAGYNNGEVTPDIICYVIVDWQDDTNSPCEFRFIGKGEIAPVIDWNTDFMEYSAHMPWREGFSEILSEHSYIEYGYFDEDENAEWTSASYVTFSEGITSIPDFAFIGCPIEKVIIPSTVKYIGKYAFSSTKASKVEIPETIEHIGVNAFYKTPWIESQFEDIYIGDIFFKNKSGNSQVTIKDGTKIIAEGAFLESTTIEKVILPDSIESIKDFAFYKSSLSTIELSDNMKNIGEYAFLNCDNLTSIILPDSVTTIGKSAFKDCDNLVSIELSDNMTIINEYLFENCDNLESVKFSNEITTIGNYAFANCPKLVGIVLSDKIKNIGTSSFENCELLDGIEIPESLVILGRNAFENTLWKTNWYNEQPDGDVYLGNIYFGYKGEPVEEEINVEIREGTTAIAGGAFSTISWELRSITIPNTVKALGNEAFYGCMWLTSLDLPDELEYIGEGAFNSCEELEKLEIPNSVKYIGSYAFVHCGFETLTIPEGITKLEDETFSCCFITNVILPEGLISIGDKAFSQCTIENLNIPSTVKHFGSAPFYETNISNIIISEGIKNIKGYLFEGCHINSIKLPSTLTHIGNGAFSCCDFANITIPSSIKFIGKNTFYECKNLTEINIPNGVVGIDIGAFYSCDSLTKVSVPMSVGYVGGSYLEYCAFQDTPWLESISVGEVYIGGVYYGYQGAIPEGTNLVLKEGTKRIKKIVDYDYRSNLVSIVIPEGVKSIEFGLFAACENLETVELPDSIEYIAYYAFNSCRKLKNINLSDNLKEIKYRSFSGCSSLKSINIPDSVKKIEDETFEGCTNLTNLKLSNNLLSIGSGAFCDCVNLENITLPESIIYIGNNVFDYTKWYENQLEGDIYIDDIYYGHKGDAKTIELAEGTRIIAGGAFSDCTSLTNITIPNSIISIGDCAFLRCTSLTNVVIPNSVTNLGESVFYGCTNLLNIFCEPATKPNGWSTYWKYGCNAKETWGSTGN